MNYKLAKKVQKTSIQDNTNDLVYNYYLSSLQEGSIMEARWPSLEGEVNETLLKEGDYLLATAKWCKQRLTKLIDTSKKVCHNIKSTR